MNFPLLPLIGVFGVQNNDLNMGLSGAIVVIATLFGVFFLTGNSYGPNRYSKTIALAGFICLGIAIFVAIVGVVNIATVFIAVVWLYLLVYWVLYRFLILNIKAAFCRKKPKNTDSVYIPDDY